MILFGAWGSLLRPICVATISSFPASLLAIIHLEHLCLPGLCVFKTGNPTDGGCLNNMPFMQVVNYLLLICETNDQVIRSVSGSIVCMFGFL